MRAADSAAWLYQASFLWVTPQSSPSQTEIFHEPPRRPHRLMPRRSSEPENQQCHPHYRRSNAVSPTGGAARLRGASGMICSSGSGRTLSSPRKGRSCAAISNREVATPVAKSPIMRALERRLSQCTKAIASKAQTACTSRADHLRGLTCAQLRIMRSRRAARAASSSVTISRCAT